jgi:intron-binding protein aquarius
MFDPLQAKIVAMTCTHAALKRSEFLQLAFQYDNLLMEEAGQILEIETFIPMLLQVCTTTCMYRKHTDRHDPMVLYRDTLEVTYANEIIHSCTQKPEEGGSRSRLKRVVLIGDHHQLPPVVQNMAIQKYSRLDQPLFTRFIRLGTPYVQLNAQVCVGGGRRRGGEHVNLVVKSG